MLSKKQRKTVHRLEQQGDLNPHPEHIYHPNGDMCINCTKASDNCSTLPFDSMPPTEVYAISPDELGIVVICSEFTPKEST